MNDLFFEKKNVNKNLSIPQKNKKYIITFSNINCFLDFTLFKNYSINISLDALTLLEFFISNAAYRKLTELKNRIAFNINLSICRVVI